MGRKPMTSITTEDNALRDFVAGQEDALKSVPPQSDKYYYQMGWEDVTYEISLGRTKWDLNPKTNYLEPIEV
jgi:hypothetical protein